MQNGNLRILAQSANVTESIAGILYRRMLFQDGSTVESMRSSRPKQMLSADTREEAMHRLITFERMFLDLDDDRSGFVNEETVFSFLSFTELGLDPRFRDEIFGASDTAKDGMLTRLEFCELCVNHLWNVPLSLLELAMRNLRDVSETKTTRNKLYWAKLAQSIDRWSRKTIIPAYLMILVIIFRSISEMNMVWTAAQREWLKAQGLAHGVKVQPSP